MLGVALLSLTGCRLLVGSLGGRTLGLVGQRLLAGRLGERTLGGCRCLVCHLRIARAARPRCRGLRRTGRLLAGRLGERTLGGCRCLVCHLRIARAARPRCRGLRRTGRLLAGCLPITRAARPRYCSLRFCQPLLGGKQGLARCLQIPFSSTNRRIAGAFGGRLRNGRLARAFLERRAARRRDRRLIRRCCHVHAPWLGAYALRPYGGRFSAH